MSERYGTPGELKEMLEELEGWLEDEIDKATESIKSTQAVGDPRYDAGRIQALRDVLDFIIVNPGG